ncbi:CPBP family intramembrane glutamic endopeptidase [Methylovirgula sp. 4M-Z18]|uniref:CPBP family intramembrane glutamic endopeptidase n=1 Tax=Methylovirgula sp. 4M-Z18 TaxID=2293567 RepID=UPI000E2E56B3|nr:CPBP family intramembrane glutamic endopeptidase [Methylovirgula sp. 4M-Z18]RFB81050.1 CPBP family intramembrane metalloprotease [Methylovirgula sp. 4M-Z18]
MNDIVSRKPGFWATLILLLRISYVRSLGRRSRQQQLFRQRTKKQSDDWSGILYLVPVIIFAGINISAAYVVLGGVSIGQRLEAEQKGKVVVESWFLAEVRNAEKRTPDASSKLNDIDKSLAQDYRTEAASLARDFGVNETVTVAKLSATVRAHGSADLIDERNAAQGIVSLGASGRIAAMLGSLALIFWATMLVFQGEGMELDTQRRRHPAWEWLLSHPVPPGAVFLAEMLAAMASNPAYYSAPVVPGILFGMAYGWSVGIAAVPLIGVPLTIATACLGKALEIAVMLHFAPRTRGGIIGLMSWFGSWALLAFPALSAVTHNAIPVAQFLSPLATVSWPWLGLFLGVRSDGSLSFIAGIIACWIAAIITIGAAVGFGVWGARKGLAGNFDAAGIPSRSNAAKFAFFGKDPAYSKELMWLMRDRGAIIQAFLIPLSMAAVQLFNMRGLISSAANSWNMLCGGAAIFGAYFLMVLGPKSLASDGTALWVALTWPRGLESLLQAKARLWSMIASCVVLPFLFYAAWLYPANSWQVGLAGLGWFFFARSQAQKAVTLAKVTPESGEITKTPTGRQMATMLGTFSFAVGVFTQQWVIAVAGIVYSYLTAAAMWQNFRARLPFLYDPWSEKLPQPPTLMHAMIAISALVEIGAMIAAMFVVFLGHDGSGVALAFGYGVSSVSVALAMGRFLSKRGIAQRDIWFWPKDNRAPAHIRWTILTAQSALGIMIGALLGSVLGLAALGYLDVLQHIPFTADILAEAQKRAAEIPHLRMAYVFVGVFFAPFAEEYLFRGLLFRALDKEWGGWRAILGSAAFFAIYHPALSWIPVGAVGIANAIIFKRTGSLAPAVILHMIYNAIVLS